MKNFCESQNFPFGVAIVLGAAVRKGGKPGPAMIRRIMHAMELVKKGIALKLMLTGGAKGNAFNEARVMKDFVVSRGLSDDMVIMENQASSTFESAQYCSHIIQEKGLKNILLVTDRYHLPRAKLAFWFFGVPVTGSPPGANGSNNSLYHNSYYVFREMFAVIWYLLKFSVLILSGKLNVF